MGVHARTYARTHAHTHARTHGTRIYYIDIHTHTNTHTHTHTHTPLPPHTPTHTHTPTETNTQVAGRFRRGANKSQILNYASMEARRFGVAARQQYRCLKSESSFGLVPYVPSASISCGLTLMHIYITVKAKFLRFRFATRLGIEIPVSRNACV